MFNAFYQLNEHPFTADISHKWLYLGTSYSEAIAHLNYGVEQTAGFILLTGEQGSGKSTLLNAFIKQLPESTDVAVIHNPALREVALLANLCDELSLPYSEPSLKHLIDRLSEFLLNNYQGGRHTVMVIDDAQHLSEVVLEQLRLLTNLETDTTKLLQIILVGDTTLKQHLNQNSLRQIAQRITVRSQLAPLNLADTNELIAHRLRVSGRHEPLFKKAAVNLIFKFSGGNPRKINQLCERALLIGFGQSSMQIDASIVRLAIKEVLGVESNPLKYSNSYLAVASFTLVSLFALALFMMITPAKQLKSAQIDTIPKPVTDTAEIAPILQEQNKPVETRVSKQLSQEKQSPNRLDKPESTLVSQAESQLKLSVNHALTDTSSLNQALVQSAEPLALVEKPQVKTARAEIKDGQLTTKQAVTASAIINTKPSWYVVQLYAGKQQPTSLDRFTCRDNKLLIRHHTDTFYITSPNLTLADAKAYRQTINNRCQLDAWVKPLPKSWQTQFTASSS